ncbi:hypothetical protein GQ53DRAFT_749069 [Thozetella sp. PMI_491]|nr:hypothetical protein GQ53DRAFT_749069 [Thozetella sp. PMI_491]
MVCVVVVLAGVVLVVGGADLTSNQHVFRRPHSGSSNAESIALCTTYPSIGTHVFAARETSHCGARQ